MSINYDLPIAKVEVNNVEIPIVGGGTPPITTGGMFTGATIPLTYKDNTHTYENTYEYKSANYNITITGLTGRATITGNGTKEVSVAFDVTSATSSLAEFTISLSDGYKYIRIQGFTRTLWYNCHWYFDIGLY